MKKDKLFTLAPGLLAIMLLASVACTPTPTSATTSENATTLPQGTPGVGVEPGGGTERAALSPSGYLLSAGFSPTTGSQQAGIWVTGQGRVSLEPDLAILSLGVEAGGATVQEARSKAAEAMAAVVAALKSRGVEDKDIRTSYFNIQPKYTYRELTRCPEPTPQNPLPETKGCYTDREQVLSGYRVTNQVSVKLRDLDSAGLVIDEVAAAGGDYIRINGISFTVEDDSAARVQAREKAVKDALAKAEQFAQLTGVAVGKLIYISESVGAVYPQPVFRGGMEYEAASSVPPTPISGGEMEVTVNVQAVFGIE